jgi:hypothetical protein
MIDRNAKAKDNLNKVMKTHFGKAAVTSDWIDQNPAM